MLGIEPPTFRNNVSTEEWRKAIRDKKRTFESGSKRMQSDLEWDIKSRKRGERKGNKSPEEKIWQTPIGDRSNKTRKGEKRR